MTLTREQQRQVREHLGHGRGDRVVTIHRDGTETRDDKPGHPRHANFRMTVRRHR